MTPPTTTLKPIKESWVAYSEIFDGPVTLCEDDGKVWFCFRDGQGRWHKEQEATPDIIEVFKSCDSVEGTIRWLPPT